MSGVVIIDYGMGNLHSVFSALSYLNADPQVSSEHSRISEADTLILPGVGSFYKAMSTLEENGLTDSLREAVLGRGRKILGICLGQQLMAEHGEEKGECAGLGFFPGTVKRIPNKSNLNVPHVGFSSVFFSPESRLFSGFEGVADFYFVHSYRIELMCRPGLSATCNYGGDFVAAYEHENVFSTQFHPEKSQTNGLRLLSNFLAA